MTPLLTTSLIVHVITGILAIGFVNIVLMHTMRKFISWPYLKKIAGWSVAFFLISWATAAYYYVVYYGGAVKPVILKGAYPWAHQIIMESKEHVFILLPFLAIALWLLTHYLEKTTDDNAKRAGTTLAFVTLALGAIIAAAGVAISGAAR